MREAGDLSAGVFDLEGRMLAQAVTGTPGHVNSMAESVKHFIAPFPGSTTMKPGDAYITNDPWMGTGHLNDFVITTPCFHKRQAGRRCSPAPAISWTSAASASGPDGTDVFMEGLYIPMLKLLDEGKVNETLMAMIRANTRLPVDTDGDVYSLIGLQRRRLPAPGRDDGRVRLDDLDELGDHIIATSSREAVLAEIAKLPKGTWCNAMTIDGYDEPITLRGHHSPSADSGIHVDYTGTVAAVAARHQRAARLHHGLHRVRPRAASWRAHIPNNAGSLEPLTVSAPEGTHPQRAEARRRVHRATSSARCCPTWSSAACARRSPTACRPRAPRACGTSSCAAA